MQKRVFITQPLLLSVADVAAQLGICRTKVYALIATEGLPTVRLGRVLRVRPAALEQWLLEREKVSA